MYSMYQNIIQSTRTVSFTAPFSNKKENAAEIKLINADAERQYYWKGFLYSLNENRCFLLAPSLTTFRTRLKTDVLFTESYPDIRLI